MLRRQSNRVRGMGVLGVVGGKMAAFWMVVVGPRPHVEAVHAILHIIENYKCKTAQYDTSL